MHDVIIIGGGVAAYSAAIFVARRGLSVLVLAKDIGGQANFTDLIENYPGLAETGGLELISKIKKQAESFGAKTLMAEADKIKSISGGFVVTAYGQQYKAQALILAYGKTPRDLGVAGEQEFKGRGVSYCATCDARLFKGKTVAVVGIGDLNLEASLLCSRFARQVYLLSKNDKLIGHASLTKAIGKKKNIKVVTFVRVESIGGKSSVSKLRLMDLRTNSKYSMDVDGIFVELGYVVDSKLVRGLLALDDLEQIKVGKNQETSVEGIFAAGDATNRTYKQAVISAGEGATAGLAAFDWLMHRQGGVGLSSDWTEIKRVKS